MRAVQIRHCMKRKDKLKWLDFKPRAETTIILFMLMISIISYVFIAKTLYYVTIFTSVFISQNFFNCLRILTLNSLCAEDFCCC